MRAFSRHSDKWESFELFYADNRDQLVRAVAFTISDIDLASESVDEALVKALKRWRKLDEGSSAAAWVYRVACNYAKSRYRRVGNHKRFAPVVAATDQVNDYYSDNELFETVNQLPYDQRSVLVCRYFLDWSIAESAAALAVSEGTIKSRTSRALQTLRAGTTNANFVEDASFQQLLLTKEESE